MTRLLFAATPAEGACEAEDEPMPSQPAPSQKLSDQMLRSMSLASQPEPPAPTQRAPIPLFHDPPPPPATQAPPPPPPPPPASQPPHAQLPPPSQMGGTQAATQADFATPADQFDLAYDPADRARSPARLEPNRAKRARGAEGGAPASLSDAGAGGAGRAAGNPWAPPGGGAAAGARRVAPRARSPPCYRSVFASEEAEAEYAPWRAPRPGAAAAAQLSRFRADFRELGMLGQGSFSRVYRARHRLDGGEYAVKRSLREVAPGGEDFARWLQEAQTLAALPPHAGLVRYFGAWAEPGAEGGERLHTQLERCDVALAVHAALGARLREGDLAEVAAQVAAALAHCHAHGVAHLDVKPDNIYCLTPPENGGDGDGSGKGGNGENGGGENEPAGGNAGAHSATAHGGSLLPPGTVFKLGDFGQAARLRGGGPAAAGAGAPVDEGDRRYLPPELLAGDHSALDKADVFSLGATLLELAAGAPLPDGGPAYRDLREGRLPLLPAVRAPLAALIRAMMAPRAADRPSAAKALRAPALRRTAAGAAAWAAANAAEPPAKAAPAAVPAAPLPAATLGGTGAGAGGARAAYGGLVLQRSKT